MKTPYILEISVDRLERALAAERGGAHRIELCRALSQGGLTPDAELVRAARELVRVPIFAMIRPRGGDFVYSNREYAEMEREVGVLRRLGVDGLVLGILQRNGQVDVQRTRQLVELARPLPVTFHRAIDVAADIYQALEEVVQSGAVRVLSSGGAATAVDGIGCLKQLVRDAAGRIVVMPGSGILAGNVVDIAMSTGAREFHAGLSSVTSGVPADEPGFEEEVRQLRMAMEASNGDEVKRGETDLGLGR